MTKKINAQKLLASLETVEASADLAPEGRRAIREERINLHLAMQFRGARRIDKAAKKAMRVAEMWHAPVSH